MDKQVTKGFSQRLRHCRIAAGYRSAQKFAESMGLEGPTYRRLERAEVDPSLSQLRLLSEHLDKTIDFLVMAPGSEAMANYIALIRKDEDTAFGVDFPDFPGCATGADTLQGALDRAREALAFHIEGLLEEGARLPVPSTLEEVMADPENRDAVVALVQTPDGMSHIRRINITLDERLIQAIDDRVSGGEAPSRSGFLALAAREKLERHST